MAITSGFFNSVNGDRKYNAEQMSMYFDKLVTSGVFPNPSTNLQVVAAGGMMVNVLPGRGMIDCRWLNNDAVEPLRLPTSDVMLNRIDAVVMVLNLNESVRDCHIEIKKGTPATTPSAPTMERSEFVKEYCLAHIYVKALTDEITQADITDTRANTNICGWVTGLIKQVDTSTLFLQWQAAYEEYFEEATDAFEEWFTKVRNTLTASATIKRSVNAYITKVDGETSIPIGIDGYKVGVDLLTVYINGLRLIEGSEYAINPNNTISLGLGVTAGTPILFEAFKIVDSEDVWSAVEMLEDVQPKIYKNVVIEPAAWGYSDNYDGYDVLIINEEIDADTIASVNFALASLDTVNNAGVLSVAETVEGGIKLYAKEYPEDDIICDYVIQKGLVM